MKYVYIRGGSWGYGPCLVSAIWVGFRPPADTITRSAGFRCAHRVAHPLVSLRGGGSLTGVPLGARAAFRYNNDPAIRYSDVGFRAVRSKKW